jgi:serine/threonine-protein kinase HipA
MKLNVSLKFSSEKVIKVGVLYQKGRDCAFEYDSSFLSRGLNPSPFRLPVKSGVNLFDWSGGMETFGMFEDSLPDGWGRRIVAAAFGC